MPVNPISILDSCTTTGIKINNRSNLPQNFKLLQNYPNPFSSSTVICYHSTKQTVDLRLSAVSQVELVIYNSLGQKVKILIDEKKPAGKQSIVWNGKNELGDTVSSGIYFYRLKLDKNFVQTKKMVYIR